MNAIVYKEYGTPENILKLEQIPIPEISDSQVLVKVHSFSLNPVDAKRFTGAYKAYHSKLPYTPCEDISGVVTKIGSNCKRIKVGDEVWGKGKVSDGGAAAEYFAIPEEFVDLKPKSLNWEEAASIPLTGLTAMQAFDLAKLQPNSKVLILGGSGGVGAASIQVAKAKNCYVSATTSTKNVDLVKSLGADQVIDYTKEEWSEVLKGQNYDVIFDTVGQDVSFTNGPLIVKPGGFFVTISNHHKHESTPQMAYQFFLTGENLAQLVELRKLADEKKLKASIAKVFPLKETVQAFQLLNTGRANGKIVVTI